MVYEPTDGSQFLPTYHNTKQDMGAVPIVDIRDASSFAKEEVAQFGVGGFLASGAFWMGLERLVTVGWYDTLFLCSCAFFVAGGVTAFFGYRQTIRRITRLERYIPEPPS